MDPKTELNWPSNKPEEKAVISAIDRRIDSLSNGLTPPNPGNARLIPLPGVMATPPTLALSSTGAASTITSGVTYNATATVGGVVVAANTDKWRLYGGNPRPAGQSGNQSTVLWGDPVSLTSGEGFFFCEFMYDGDVIEIKFRDPARFRITVDGQYINTDIITQAIAAGDFGVYRYKLDFSSAGGKIPRRITIESIYGFNGLTVQPEATVWIPDFPLGPKVIWFGDSYVNSQPSEGPTATWSGFFSTASKLLGWKNYTNAGIGGTGFFNRNSIARFEERVALDITPYRPDIVVVWGGQNDGAATAAEFRSGVTNTLAAIRSGNPGVSLIVAGPNYITGSPTATFLQMRDTMRSVARDYGALFVDILGGPTPYDGDTAHYVNTGWLTGNGKSGATSSTYPANTNRYIGGADGSDANHLTQVGHDYFGYRFAAQLSPLLPALGAP